MFKRRKKISRLDAYLDTLYSGIWTGQDIDRRYAWLRVIEHLRAWNNSPELIARARIRMTLDTCERSEQYYVAGTGRLIQITVIC